ncbi:Methyltransferase domain-containing protein [Yoonia tamlensis]|uniref:Methyltransferase domain-containing protein n=1 Tax=Yoonia tamlensis TaxID=390270 RepID=A0A1I6GSY4_9RHOB|nr:class I SAM-dependent methyltransferase [Yoonia tamlensis]SFR45191.1 Methyltransferase domain-containing protein [Yoonia tamlensis]
MASASFWDKAARKYAARPVPSETAYQETLARTRNYLSAQDHLLEIGCGTGSTALLLAPFVAKITATDISGAMLEIAEAKREAGTPANIRFLQVPAMKPLADAPFDAICAFSILHLLDDLPASLDHLYGQLKPGGYLISKTACIGEMNRAIPVVIRVMQMFKKAPFVNSFTVGELEKSIARAGFELVETGYFGKNRSARFVVARRPA